MLLLVSTSDKIRLVTSGSSAIDVHASYMDRSATAAPAEGRKNTAIASATTTDIVESPASGSVRNVKTITIRNKGVANNTVTVIHTDGTTPAEMYQVTLGPGAAVYYTPETGFFVQSRVIEQPPNWADKIIGCSTLDPGEQMLQMQRAGNVAPTPTNITTSIARCAVFIPMHDITVNRVRWYGVGATTAVYRIAIYQFDDLTRLTSEIPLTTGVDTWGSVSVDGLSLTADVPYFIACSVNATGATAGIGAIGGSLGATTGRVNTTPANLPGNMSIGSAYMDTFNFQFAVTSGALPDPAATPAAQAAWVGGMPAFWLDNNTSA